MIPVINHGAGFRGILQYAIQKEGAYVIGHVQGSVDELSADFGVIRGKNQRVRKPVLHMSLAIHPSEHLSDHRWIEIVRKMMVRLGYQNNFYVIVRHTDEPQEHVHVIASRIRSDTYKTVDTYQERWRASSIAAQLEQEYGLQKAALDVYRGKERPSREREKRGEAAMRKARGVTSSKAIIRARIDAACTGRPTMTAFIERLARYGVGFKANVGGEHISGVTYELNGFFVQGSKIGRSWNTLLKRVDYRQDRDFAAVCHAKARLNRPPEDLSPEAAKALDQQTLQSTLKRLRPTRKQRASAGRQPFGAPAPPRALGRRRPGELQEILQILGQAAHRIDANPFSSTQQKEEEDRDQRNPDRHRS
ncbi:relaxase/mobilization nuclease domain-containing protein [Acanthopleuribacter pedis]|uniref:Relaxase/mobilization nuclease domain-containing protein n=1 Tax=Acanthopleuribacter pedis TaxID=442870 RepID=A0A8J7U8A8_9BACT|nr:relaxase/mobilization nuclease domain-containing protein [Acanthopleuribacter pedis]MBO1323383.1 relaxase/mobilization nuclease domain-containing protein [Acanthopleuribacter pedis]